MKQPYKSFIFFSSSDYFHGSDSYIKSRIRRVVQELKPPYTQQTSASISIENRSQPLLAGR